MVANVYADRLLKLHAGAHFRIKQQIKEAVVNAADACAARVALCEGDGSAEGLGLASEWSAVEEALREARAMIIADDLMLPQGSPI